MICASYMCVDPGPGNCAEYFSSNDTITLLPCPSSTRECDLSGLNTGYSIRALHPQLPPSAHLAGLSCSSASQCASSTCSDGHFIGSPWAIPVPPPQTVRQRPSATTPPAQASWPMALSALLTLTARRTATATWASAPHISQFPTTRRPLRVTTTEMDAEVREVNHIPALHAQE